MRRSIAVGVLLSSLFVSSATAGVLDEVGGVVGGTLQSDPVADFSFAGSLQLFGPKGDPVLAQPDDTIKGVISLDLVTAGGTADMGSDIGFFGVQWDMHDVALSACGDFTVNASLLFDWNGNFDIPVLSKFRLEPMLNPDVTSWQTPADGMTFTVEVIDTDDDGIPGQAMTSGPFPGFTPVFTGTAKTSRMGTGYHKNEHVEVAGPESACTPLGSSLGGFF
ncbi:MAG: hypothetical protein M3357_19380 [Actinomycetota bacterium]|nr:hypothetical protein [Actinomycetota bacterium]